MREHGLAVPDDLLRRRLLSFGERDEGLRHLAPFLVRDRNHRRLQHRGMAHHRLLHFDGADVLPAGDDDVLLPVAQLDRAVRVSHRQIPAVEPAAMERFRGRLRIAEVPEHDHVSSHHHFAHGPPVGRDVVHLVIDDTHFARAGVGETLAGLARGTLAGRQPLLAGRGDGDGEGTVDLGEPIDVVDLEVQVGEVGDQRGRGRCPGGEQPYPARQPASCRVRHQHGAHRRSRAEVRHPFPEQLPHPRRFHPGNADAAGARGGGRPGKAPAVAVEHRQRPEVLAVGREAVIERHRERVQVRAAVVVDDALRPAGGSGGVVDGDRLILALDRRSDLRVAACVEEGLPVAGKIEPLHLGRDARGLGEQLGGEEDRARSRVLDDVRDLVGVQAGVDRDQHAAGERNAEMRQQQRLGIQRKKGDAVALVQPVAAQSGGQTAGARPHRPPRHAQIAVDDSFPLGVDLARALEKMDGAQLLTIHGGVGHVFLPLGGPESTPGWRQSQRRRSATDRPFRE